MFNKIKEKLKKIENLEYKYNRLREDINGLEKSLVVNRIVYDKFFDKDETPVNGFYWSTGSRFVEMPDIIESIELILRHLGLKIERIDDTKKLVKEVK
jgi:hypothetical protein